MGRMRKILPFFSHHFPFQRVGIVLYYNSRGKREVEIMREMKRPVVKPRRMMKLSEAGKHGLMLRRAGNHNAHIITPHGKVQAGRKGRKG